MKILHITPTYYPATYWGGTIFTVYHMNNALARIPGVEVKVLTTDSSGAKVSDRLSDEKKRMLFPYEVIFTCKIAGACISAGLLKKMLQLVRWADVVHLSATFSFPTIPTLALCSLYEKPVVWSLRGALLDDQNRYRYDPQTGIKRVVKAAWLGICGRFIQPGRVAIHVTTGQEREAGAKVYPEANYVVVPSGVEVPEALPVRDVWLPDGRLRLMFMGRLAPKKGIENLLQAVAKVEVPVSLDVYGTSTIGQGGQNYGERLVSLAKELGILGKKVRFHGHVDGEAKARAFMEADVCAIPSYSENFCIVVAEALAMGLPVIVSARLAWGEVISRGCGLVVENEPDSLAEAITIIKGMDVSKMGERGWDWTQEAFRWEAIASSMCGIYQKLLDRVNQAT